MSDQYVEIIGVVESATRLKMFKVMNIGDKIGMRTFAPCGLVLRPPADMPAVNHTIELMHTSAMSRYWSTIV
jgi:hypothetical protein